MPLKAEVEAETPACPHCGGPMPCKPCGRNARRPGTSRRGNTLTAVLPVGERPDQGQVDEMLRSRGYNPADWRIVTLTVNQWEALARIVRDGEIVNEPVVLSQTKAVLAREIPEAETDWGRFLEGLRTRVEARQPLIRLEAEPGAEQLVVCLGDDQAPFVNWPLHELTCEALRDLHPTRFVYMGDGPDFPALSRYLKLGTRFDSSLQQDLDILHRVLAERLQAAGLDSGDYLLGNHEWRLTKQLAAKLPALLGLRRANSEEAPVLSVENLARLADLGFTVAADRRGSYPYGSVHLTRRLIAQHGHVVRKGAGNSVAATFDRLEASLVVGHTHRLAVTHVTRWTPAGRPVVYTLAETGTMADLDGLGYTVRPDWQPGWVTAHIHQDGSHHVEAAVYRDRALRWRGQQWKLTARGVRAS